MAPQLVDHLTQKYNAIKQAYSNDELRSGPDFSHIGRAYLPLKETNRKVSIFNKILGRNHFRCMPISVQIDNIGFCNLRCPMCPTHGSDADHAKFQSKTYTMTREMTERIATEAFPFALQCSTSGIGEGLLHRDIDAIIQNAGHYGTTLFVNSNGTTLGTKSLPKLFGITHLRLSIDGALPATFEAIRKGAQFSKVLHSARVLKVANDLLPPSLHIKIGVNFSLCASTVPDLPFMVDLAHFVGAGSLICNKMEFSINQTFHKEELLEEDYERYPAFFAHYRALAEPRAEALGIRLDCPDSEPDIAPDQSAGPSNGGLFVPGNERRNDTEPPIFEDMVDAQQVAEEAGELATKVLFAAIERHSGHDEAAVQQAKDHAHALSEKISGDFEQSFSALTAADRDWIKEAPTSDTEVLDCNYLQAALYFMANGETRPCCVGSLQELAGDIRTQSVAEIFQGPKLNKFNADFRNGDLCDDCRTCPVKTMRPVRDMQQLRNLVQSYV